VVDLVSSTQTGLTQVVTAILSQLSTKEDARMDRVLLVDDDIETGVLVVKHLEVEGFEVEFLNNGEEAIGRSLSGEHVLVLLDVVLPGLNGFDVLRRIRAESHIPVLIVTARNDEVDRIVGLEIGADDYLPKPFNPRELVARIHAVLRRTRLQPAQRISSSSPQPLCVGDVELDKKSWSVVRANEQVHLTAVEFQLLEVFLCSAGRVLERQELAQQVLGRNFNPLDRSIDMHVSKLRRKLGRNLDGRERIKTIRGVGYCYIQPDCQVLAGALSNSYLFSVS
jgi:DNA-binding response OmpR family regulator